MSTLTFPLAKVTRDHTLTIALRVNGRPVHVFASLYREPARFIAAARVNAGPALCNWCVGDVPATHNLSSHHDAACADHHFTYFVDVERLLVTPPCGCSECVHYARMRRSLGLSTDDVPALGMDFTLPAGEVPNDGTVGGPALLAEYAALVNA